MLFTFHNLRHISFGLTVIFLTAVLRLAAAEPSPAGLWKTFDDHTHKARGTVRIYEENGAFFGKIESSFKPEELNERCFKCTSERKDLPIMGLVILRDMRKNGSEYDGGDILDPETGSVYKCRLTLGHGGEEMQVRGYLGLSIFGRTQTWVRIPDNP
jgi:uncharacterized protein (DUF2147 family)